MFRTFAILISAAILVAFNSPHPLHVSIMQIDHISKEKTLQVTLKSFVDDVELAIKNHCGTPLFFNMDENKIKIDSCLEAYLNEKLKMNLNGKEQPLEWVGWEIDKDEVFIYFQYDSPKKLVEVSVANSVLFDEYVDQTNIVHLKSGEENRSAYINYEVPVCTFDL